MGDEMRNDLGDGPGAGTGPLGGILAALEAISAEDLGRELCDACREVLGVSGAAITVMAEGGEPGLLCGSDTTATALEDLQGTLGEGPSVEAHRGGEPAGGADLTDPDRSRWMAFGEPALALGAAAMFAFPLRLGGLHLGVLSVYQRHTGRLSDDQYACALVVAAVLTQTVLAMQARAPAGALDDTLGNAGDHRAEVHQAAGMVAVRFATTVAEAMVRLRARAYGEGRALDDVARDVVGRRRAIG